MQCIEELKKLKKEYNNAHPIEEFTGEAEEECYWIKAVQENDLSQIKIMYESLSNCFIDPPYLLSPQYFFSLFTGVYVRSIDGESKYKESPLGMSIYTAQRSREEWKNFSFDYPIILSEGPMDAELISTIYPFSFASLTTIPSRKVLNLISCVTNHLIFIPDNDEAGKRSKNRLKKRMEGLPSTLKYDIIHIRDIKDPGELFKEDYQNHISYNLLKSKILNILNK